jgi:hypothetical protein
VKRLIVVLSLVLVVLGLGSSAFAVDKPIVHVFLLMGQSNMVGTAPTSDITTSGSPLAYLNYTQSTATDSVKIANTSNTTSTSGTFNYMGVGNSSQGGSFGCELSLGRDLGARYAGQTIYFIKAPYNATSLSADWKPGTGTDYYTNAGTEWKHMIDATRAALNTLSASYTPQIDGFFWHQGESDLSQSTSSYETNLRAFIADVRSSNVFFSQYEVPNMPFFVGGLGDCTGWGTETQINNIITAQKDVAETWLNSNGSVTHNASTSPVSNTYFTELHDLARQSDNVHFTGASYATMGDRFAATYALTPEPATLSLLAFGGLAMLWRRRRK